MILFLYGIALNTIGQSRDDYTIDVQHFTIEDGLSHKKINRIFQDHLGYIWVATRYGLNRYDGHEWKTFTKEKNSLEDNYISDIHEDDQGWLWIGHKYRDYLPSFINVITLEVLTFEERFPNLHFTPSDITNFSSNYANRAIYVIHDNTIKAFQNGQWKSMPISFEENVDVFKEMYHYDICIFGYDAKPDFNLKIGLIDTTNQWIPAENISFQSFDESKYCDDKACKIYWLRGSKYIEKLYKYSIGKIDFSKFIPSRDTTTEELVWMLFKTELKLFNEAGDLICDFVKEYPELPMGGGRLYLDNQKNIWIGNEFGLYKIQVRPKQFKNYLVLPFASSIPDIDKMSIAGLYYDNDTLWGNTRSINQYLINTKTNQVSSLTQPYIINKNRTRTPFRPILKTKDNSLLLGREIIVQYKHGQSSKIYYPKHNLRNDTWSLFEDIQKKIWCGTENDGLLFIEGDSIAYFNQYNEFKKLEQSDVYHFLQWDNKHILVASSSGMYVLHPQKGILHRFSSNSPPTQKIPFNLVYHIHRDKIDPNILWLATSDGILKLTIDSQTWSITEQQSITRADGLSNNTTYAIFEDQFQNLWISSDYGINRYHKISGQINIYTVKDGLPDNEFNRIAHFQAEDGQIFFGTINGVTSFYPEDLINDTPAEVPLRITSFQQYNGNANRLEDKTAELLQTNTIVLQPNDKFINLKFALLEYREMSQVKYFYQISGQGDEWFILSGNELRLSGLPYGKNKIRVKAQLSTGAYTDNTLEINVRVLRPIYLRWWFIVLELLIILGAIYWWNVRRVRQILARQQELEATVAERTAQIQKDKETIERDKAIIEAQAEELQTLDSMKSRFFANVSHELRTPLTLMLAPINNTIKL